MYELFHELPNNLGLMILGNEELLRLFTWVFIDLMIHGFELLTRGFELVTRNSKLMFYYVTCKHVFTKIRNQK